MVSIVDNSAQHLAVPPLHPRVYEDEAVHRVYLFGAFRLFRNQERLDEDLLRRKKARLILIWFLLNPGKPCSMEQFIDLFWPDSPPRKAIGNFHVAMHCLRRTLDSRFASGKESLFIHRRSNNFYGFEAGEGWWTDVGDLEMVFDRACAYDSQGDQQRAIFYHRRVASYGVRGFLPTAEYGAWVEEYQRRYEQIYAHALTRLMEFYVAADQPEELLEYAYQMLQLDHQNVRAAQVIIDAHVRSGHLDRARQLRESFLRSVPQDLRHGIARRIQLQGA